MNGSFCQNEAIINRKFKADYLHTAEDCKKIVKCHHIAVDSHESQ